MRSTFVTLALILVCSACASKGPVYRGAPPPGMSHKEYAAQLSGASTRPQVVDRSPGRGSSVSPDPTPAPAPN